MNRDIWLQGLTPTGFATPHACPKGKWINWCFVATWEVHRGATFHGNFDGNGMFHPSPEGYWLKRHPLEMNDFLMNQAASMLCMCGSPSCLRNVSTSGSKCPQLGRGSWCKMMFLDSWCPLSLPPTQTWYCDWIGLRETSGNHSFSY